MSSSYVSVPCRTLLPLTFYPAVVQIGDIFNTDNTSSSITASLTVAKVNAGADE